MEEFRRVRQALGRPSSAPNTTPSGATPPTATPPSAPAPLPAPSVPLRQPIPEEDESNGFAIPEPVMAAPTPVVPDAERSEDLLEKYRQGATTVAKDSSFKGSLKSDSNLTIEGNFDGELEARSTIFIAPGANVRADVVRASDVIVAGTLNGTVDASGRFHAMPSAEVTGEINSRILVVDQGSQVNCRFVMKARGGNEKL